MPNGVARTQLLCYLGVAAFALVLLGTIGFVLEPHGGSRMAGVAWSAFAAAMVVFLLLTGVALGRGRRWSWVAGLAVCVLGALAGLAMIVVMAWSYASERAAARGQPATGADIGAGLLVIAVVLGLGLCLACLATFRSLATPESRRWFGR